MELPKNITQIGEADKNCKVYVEDYVVSYIKQLNRRAEDKPVTIAIYGRCSREQNMTYCFAYGACLLTSLQREVRHLSQAQLQEIERQRRKYFAEYQFLGYQILNGELVEGFFIQEQDCCRPIKGYACFYEKNDSMLAYMLDNRSEEHQPEDSGQEKYIQARANQEERRQRYEEKKPERLPKLRLMRTAAVAMFAVLCLAGAATVHIGENAEDVTLGDTIRQIVADLGTRQLPEDQEAVAVNAGATSTLVAEESLTEALQRENAAEAAAEQEQPEGSSEAQQPETTAEPEETADPTPEVTEQPAAQTAEESVPTEAPQNTSTESVQQVYTIQPGDTLIKISTRLYGSDSMVDTICEINHISDPDNIQTGQKIILP